MARTLPLLIGLALLASTVASARTPPHPSHHKQPHVSATVPYAAPWQTEFNRYSTQLYVPTRSTHTALDMTIPTGQWWRIVYLHAGYSTDANPGTRSVFFRIFDPAGAILFFADAPATQPASSVFQYTWGPGLSVFSVSANAASGTAVSSLPDLLWPPGCDLNISANFAQVGDDWSTGRTYAIEVYTEDYQGNIVPVLTPTPLIS